VTGTGTGPKPEPKPRPAGRSFPSLGFCLSVSSSAYSRTFIHVFAVDFCSVRTYLHL